jgi:3',5'-cyclic AMP phosphodiesterase CpdA
VKLYAVSDLHLASPANRAALAALPAHPDDWLIVAGDVGERAALLELALAALAGKFRRLIWVPGNHDLHTVPGDPVQARGEERYRVLVDICRRHGALTPEDGYPEWPGGVVLAPLFMLYDYTMRRPGTTKEQAMRDAQTAGVMCSDEVLLHPDPHPSREEWCRRRVRLTERRLDAIPARARTVLISHFPLLPELVTRAGIRHFGLWCGTRLTADWHVRYRAEALVYGHLHMPDTLWQDGVRCEEVSFGYPYQVARRALDGIALREVLG